MKMGIDKRSRVSANLDNQRVLVVGLGRTGIALTRFLVKAKARVTVTDICKEGRFGNYLEECRRLGAILELGGHSESTFLNADLIIVSPGVPHTIPPVAAAVKAGIPVIGEMELASVFVKEPIAAVTGTNGKTTTTALLGEMLIRSGKKVFVGGNIGNPLIGHVDEGTSVDVVVLEVSSFQLDTIRSFRPRVGALLNVTPDHLDRYPDLMAYAQAKGRLFENQDEDDVAVLNGGDSIVRSITADIQSRKWFFAGCAEGETGAMLFEDHILIRGMGPSAGLVRMQDEMRFDLSGTYFTGRYGVENAAAAGLSALASGASPEGIQSALQSFKGLSHRLESVATRNGVRFINDSKATNVYSVLCALEAFTSPLILILGGRDKGSDFTLLREMIHQRVKKVILLGEAAGRIRAALKGAISMVEVEDMPAAVKEAFRSAVFGDVVLLSPACASFDMYNDYVHRGEAFRDAVEAIQ